MAGPRPAVVHLLAALLVTAVVLYATMYWRSELSGDRGDRGDSEAALEAAAKLSQADYEDQLAKKDAEIVNISKTLWDLMERNPRLADGDDTAFLVKSILAVKDSHTNYSSESNSIKKLSTANMLTNLGGESMWLQPQKALSYKKRQASLIIGISHVHRPKESYLMATLESLLNGMKHEEAERTIIVVQVSEPWNVSYYLSVCKQVQSQFSSHVTSGLIEIILPPEHFYPDLTQLQQRWGNTAEETRWLAKQSLDYVFLMTYSFARCKYYLQLEDDVLSTPNYVSTMLDYVAKQDASWVMVDSSSQGFLGKLFRSETLAALIQFIAIFYEHKPVDVLLFNYFYVRECFTCCPAVGQQGVCCHFLWFRATPKTRYQNVLVGEAAVSEKDCPEMGHVVRTLLPPLLQHIGLESSHVGRVNKPSNTLLDSGQQNPEIPKVISHINPPATVATSLKQYQDFSLDNCYSGISAFWALNPQPDDFILISFVSPVNVKRYRLLTGDQKHPGDKAFGATIEVLPSSPETTSRHNETTAGSYISINKFNESVVIDGTSFSLADGTVPSELNPVQALRVSFHEGSQNWLLLKEVHIELIRQKASGAPATAQRQYTADVLKPTARTDAG